MSSNSKSGDIFARYHSSDDFEDRFSSAMEQGVTVIIPVIHSNALWRKNLESFYREIPIAQLLLADGGCTDDTVQIAEKFPRVRVLDHRDFVTLGFSIRKLIEEVKTEWFIYLQSDVFLPSGWFDDMTKYQDQFDWFGCRERHTIMVEYDGDFGTRPWAGSQMGRKTAFEAGLDRIDDDYVYRQEDYVFSDLVERSGFTVGEVSTTFHYHQTAFRESPYSRRVLDVTLDLEVSPEEQHRQFAMHGRGIVKYVQPGSWDLAIQVAKSNQELKKLGFPDDRATSKWIATVNPGWGRRVRIASFALAAKGGYARVVNWPPEVLGRLVRAKMK